MIAVQESGVLILFVQCVRLVEAGRFFFSVVGHFDRNRNFIQRHFVGLRSPKRRLREQRAVERIGALSLLILRHRRKACCTAEGEVGLVSAALRPVVVGAEVQIVVPVCQKRIVGISENRALRQVQRGQDRALIRLLRTGRQLLGIDRKRRIDRQKIGGALCAGQKILQITDVLVQLRLCRYRHRGDRACPADNPGSPSCGRRRCGRGIDPPARIPSDPSILHCARRSVSVREIAANCGFPYQKRCAGGAGRLPTAKPRVCPRITGILSFSSAHLLKSGNRGRDCSPH